ncbi:hypothetical protein BpHYR1_041917 [Brachionus plicatilis]|uniref:Uncharacterized protein n=1 Tax=Brachionus plicatilis TaxID=10195 RepID=A0A3M7PG07_BRAPC|nr:hypothetical protein BpHYR1_041917 [Brachionus plicatilis]
MVSHTSLHFYHNYQLFSYNMPYSLKFLFICNIMCSRNVTLTLTIFNFGGRYTSRQNSNFVRPFKIKRLLNGPTTAINRPSIGPINENSWLYLRDQTFVYNLPNEQIHESLT